MPPDSTANRFGTITMQCVVAMVLGIIVAQLAPEATGAEAPFGAALEALSRGWGNFFRLLAVPLTACLVFTAILSSDSLSHSFGRVSACVPPVFIGLMIPGFALTYFLVPAMMSTVFEGVGFAQSVDAPAAARAAVQSYQWIDDVIPPNFLSAVVADNILGVIVVTLVMAFALRQTGAPVARLAMAAQTAVDTMFIVAGWLLRASPIVVFAAVIPMAKEGAATLGGVVLAYIVIEVVLLLAITLVLLVLAMLAFRGSPRKLLISVGPSLLAALTTRSSVATVPLVIRSAKNDLGVHPDVAGYVASLAGALLKASRSVNAPGRLLILGIALSIPISVQQYVAFCVTMLVLSVSTSGIPKAISGERSLSAFVAIGVPAGPATMLGSLTWATDPLLTLINTAAYIAATLWVSRIVPSPAIAATPAYGGATPLAEA